MLLPKISRPPQCRLWKIYSPRNFVLASRNRDSIFSDESTIDKCLNLCRAAAAAIELCIQSKVGALNRCVLAKNAKSIDSYRAGVRKMNGSPDTARVGREWSGRVLKNPCDRSASTLFGWRAVNLDCNDMIG